MNLETETLVHSPHEIDVESFRDALAKSIRISVGTAGVIRVDDWYRLPEDARAAELLRDEPHLKIFFYPRFAVVDTEDALFWPPVLPSTSDNAISQYSDFICLVATLLDADLAMLYPLGNPKRPAALVESWLNGEPVIFDPTLTAFSLVGFRSAKGFRTVVLRNAPPGGAIA